MDLTKVFQSRGIRLMPMGAKRLDPKTNSIELNDGETLDYDYLVIATGPDLAFDEVEGLGPAGHTHSVCLTDHAAEARKAFDALVRSPGPIVVGAAAGASCFGPAYEFAFILDAALRKAKVRDQVPMTFVTPEPMSAISASTAWATPRACWKARCARSTSNGSPMPASPAWRPAA